MASPTPPAGALRNRAMPVALYALCTALMAGCPSGGGGPDGRDGGEPPDDGGGTGSARLQVDVAADEATIEEGLATLVEARIGVAEVRARNDRGGEFEPVIEQFGSVDVLAGEPIVFGSVTPATYGRITLRLEAGDWGDAFRLAFEHDGGTLRVVGRDELTIDVRCEIPTRLSPRTAAVLRLELEAEDVWDSLVESGGPPDGDVLVDAETEPVLLAAAEDALRAAWSLSCEGATEASSEAESEEP